MTTSDFRVVLVTAPSAEKAREMAKLVVSKRLAACVNIIPGLQSVYQWQGELCVDDEVLCIIKTTSAAFHRLRDEILSAHPYDCPEVIALPIEQGSADYLKWLAGQIS